jgi:hypothetical protein
MAERSVTVSDQPDISGPNISVIVPVYNVQGHIAACLLSLRTQSFADFEVLVIDDGSTDDSAAHARDAIAGDPRFQLIQQDNRGLSGARNTGLDRARGQAIAFVDGDDQVMPDYLAALWQGLQDSGADWVACALRSCFPDGSGHTHSAIHGAADLALHPVPRAYGLRSWSDVIRHFPSAWNKLYRRSLIADLRFDEGTWFEDHMFFLRAALRTDQIWHIPQALYLQTRGRAGQITTQDDDRIFEQFPVLQAMGALMSDSPRPGAREGFARSASRLLFERSTALKCPDRRARFLAQSARFLQEQSLKYTPDWDSDLPQAFGLELNGTLPLSLILEWDGQDQQALQITLDSLQDQPGPGHEILLPLPSATQAPPLPDRVQVLQGKTPAEALTLEQARGRYVMLLRAGDRLHPTALQHMVEMMLRSRAQMGISQAALGRGSDPAFSHGFLDDRPAPDGPFALTPATALALLPDLGNRIFERRLLRDLLTEQPDLWPDIRHPGWPLALRAALSAQRCAYLPWAAVALSRFDSPPAPRPFGRDFDAMCAALPHHATQALPEGWKKRLFARHLRETIDTALPPGPNAPPRMHRLKQGIFLAKLSACSIWRGFSRATPSAAGLDSNVEPKIKSAIHPLGALLKSYHLRPANTDFGTLVPMLLFPLYKRGLVRLRVTFQDQDYANLSFRTARGGVIPLHLSLRLREGRVVLNDTRTDGHWRSERSIKTRLNRSGHDLTIELTPPRVRVLLDGRQIFLAKPRRPWRRSGLRGLGQITHLELAGGLTPMDLAPALPKPSETGSNALRLDPRLTLRGTANQVQISTIGPLPLCAAPGLRESPAQAAILPGRVWKAGDSALAPPDSFAITQPDGATLLLTRADLARRISDLLTHQLGSADPALAATVLEHLHHGALLPLMSPQAQTQACQLARTMGQPDLLPAPDQSPDQAPDKTPDNSPTIDPIGSQVDQALRQFSTALARDPRPDPAALLRGLKLPTPSRRALFLSLSDVFCREDLRFDTLFDLAKDEGLEQVTANPDTDDIWSLSAKLPFLLRSQQNDTLLQALWRLNKPHEGWIQTAALGWTVRQAQTQPGLPDALREDVLYGWFDILANLSWDYWGRTTCHEMLRTAYWLLQHLQRDDYMRRDLVAACLRHFGLSRAFWQGLAAAGPIPADLQLAASHFGCLTSPDTPQAAQDRALSFFEQHHNADPHRLRLELFGPASTPLPPAGPLTRQAVEGRSLPPAQATLRHMAFPGTSPVDPDLARIMGQDMADLYETTPRARRYGVQQELAFALEQRLFMPQNDISDLLDDLSLIAGDADGFLGLGLALDLLAARLALGQKSAGIAQLSRWITRRIQAIAPVERAALPRMAALAGPLARLQRLPAPEAQKICNRFRLPAPPVQRADLPPVHPLYDTLVTVFSCRRNLTSHIPALRQSWLPMLEDLGIPYVIIVGGGDNHLDGDVLHLDAPDDYEGLPQKTLATLRWVHEQSAYAHMVKVDDDCLLNAPLFFRALSYRKHHYYGRKLTRTPGQLDRGWHQGKSTSERGRHELDKSPEPSLYADGGSGYALSRHAMKTALTMAASPAGQRLIASSFMEDKLLGDLLSLGGIHVSDEDYRVSIRRCTHAGATPIPYWLNSFLPSAHMPLHLAHLDSPKDMAQVQAGLSSPTLSPSKIWPSFQPVRLGHQSNALDYLSPPAALQAARQAEVAVVACVRNEMFMLPHFLTHYRRLGVESFLITDNASDDGSREYLLDQPDVALFSVDTDYNRSHYGVAWQQALLSAFRQGKWSLVADADELLVWQSQPDQTLSDLLRGRAFQDAEAVRLFMLDMYPKGPLEQANFAGGDLFGEAGFADRTPFLHDTMMRGPFGDAPAWTSALRHRLIPGSKPNLFVAQKLALLRYHPFMRLSDGLHFVGDARIAPRELIFGHFKYNADFARKARTEVARGQHWGNAEEYRKYMALSAEARSQIYDPDLSLPWDQVPFVRDRLDLSDSGWQMDPQDKTDQSRAS